MASTITLQTDCADDIVLVLNRNYTAYNGRNPVDVVYQDAKYEYIISGDEFAKPIESMELRINNKPIAVDFIPDEGNVCKIYVKPRSKSALTPFLLLYGISEIALYVLYSDKTQLYLFSNYLAIAIDSKYKESMISVKDMLDDIFKKDHSLLYKVKPRNVSVYPQFLKNQDDKFDKEIATIKSIINGLKKNMPYFMNNPRTKTVPEFRVDSLEKLHTVNSKNLSYIATHPEQLKQSFSSSGLFVNKRQMIPEKTLVSTQRFSCDTPENRVILSFIQTLLHHLHERKNEISKVLSESVAAIRLKGNIQERYILSTAIIEQYTQITLGEHLSAVETLEKQCIALLAQYKKALPCTFSVLHHVPPPTPIFLEVYHYRNVYEMINLWFSIGDFSIPAENIKLHFSSADTIFEYFCLLNISDIIVSLGYSENIEKRTKYKYIVNDPRYIQTDEDNTYYFNKGDSEVTLFYQPIIYSENSKTTNGITLFRTDGNFYSPDFVIRKSSPEGVFYGILDAKWRTQAVLRDKESNGSLPDLVYKYLYSVVDKQNLNNISFFWLLQGKDDSIYKPTYFHNCGNISRTKTVQFQNATGIVRLTPRAGVQELTRILRTFI